MTLTDIIQRNDTLPGRIFDWAIIVLIVISIITLTIETLPDLSSTLRKIIDISEVIILGVFTLEYILRIYTAPGRFRYIFSFYGIIDFLTIFPFFLSGGLIDARTLRIIRLVRVLRIIKLTRYMAAMERFRKAIVLVKEEIMVFTAITVILLYLSSVGIYAFEYEAQPEIFASILHSMWWATATLTTVGYGDIFPVTAAGKLFTFIILLCGLGIVAVPSGLLAAALSQVSLDEKDEKSHSTNIGNIVSQKLN